MERVGRQGPLGRRRRPTRLPMERVGRQEPPGQRRRPTQLPMERVGLQGHRVQQQLPTRLPMERVGRQEPQEERLAAPRRPITPVLRPIAAHTGQQPLKRARPQLLARRMRSPDGLRPLLKLSQTTMRGQFRAQGLPLFIGPTTYTQPPDYRRLQHRTRSVVIIISEAHLLGPTNLRVFFRTGIE